MAETILKFVTAGALSVALVAIIWFGVCALIDFTRKVEKPLRGLENEDLTKTEEDGK